MGIPTLSPIMTDWQVTEHDPRDPDVVGILERHLAFARSVTAPEDVHALDLDGLLDPSITFVGLRDDGVLLGIGALKQLDDTHFELKSIHTAHEARGRGVARAVVQHLVDTARARGATRVSLETGSMDEFAPSRALYANLGFVESQPFHEYSPSRASTFMTLDLSSRR